MIIPPALLPGTTLDNVLISEVGVVPKYRHERELTLKSATILIPPQSINETVMLVEELLVAVQITLQVGLIRRQLILALVAVIM